MTHTTGDMEQDLQVARVPDLSIIIPVFERPMTLTGTLTALFEQIRFIKSNFLCEIVIGDDGSAVDIRSLVTATMDNPLIEEVKWVRAKGNVGRAAIRNATAAAALGRRLLFLDCDSYPVDGLIAGHYAPEAGDNTVIVGRRLELGWDSVAQLVAEGGIPKFESFEEDYRFSYLGFPKYLPQLSDSPTPWLNSFTNNISIPRKLFTGIDGFDEKMRRWGHEDIEIGFRLYKAGAVFQFDAEACVVHLPHGRSLIGDEADSLTNLEFVKRKHPTYETELLGLETYTNIERKVEYFGSKLQNIRQISGRATADDVLQQSERLVGQRALWIGSDLNVPAAPGVISIEHGHSRVPNSMQLLGFWTPFGDDEFDTVINVDLWRFYPVSDLCLAIEEGLRIAQTVILVESLPRKEWGDSWIMSSNYLHEALTTKNVAVLTARTEGIHLISITRRT